MTTTFDLDPQLATDTLPVGNLPVCRVLLMNDARFPWMILVPRVPGLIELDALDRDARIAVMDEVQRSTVALRTACRVDKINLGALGNMVRQLHLHVVGRTPRDAAWPGPVWGCGSRQAYPPDAARKRVRSLARALGLDAPA